MKYKVTLINLPSSKSLISFAAWIPSSFKFFSMSLDRATAALSSADMAQPIFGSFQPVRRDNAEALFNKCEKNWSGRQLIMSLNLLLLCAYSVLYFVLIKKNVQSTCASHFVWWHPLTNIFFQNGRKRKSPTKDDSLVTISSTLLSDLKKNYNTDTLFLLLSLRHFFAYQTRGRRMQNKTEPAPPKGLRISRATA